MESVSEKTSDRRDLANGAPAPVRQAPAAAEPPKKSARTPLLILGGLLVAVVAGIAIYSVMTANEESTDDAQVEADVVPLGSRVSGQVLHVLVQDNQVVKKDQLLVELDPADYVARQAQAQAELDTAKAQAAAADAQVMVIEASARGGYSSAKAMVSSSSVAVSSADAQIAAAKAALQRSDADARKADADLKRAQELRTANAGTQESLDHAQAAQDSAEAARLAARAQLAAAEESKHAAQDKVEEAKGRLDQSAPIDSQIATAHAQADLAHARVKSAEASLALAANQLAYTKVYASADGEVSRLGVHEGQLIQPGQPVVELVPLQTYIVANFKETQVGKMKPGQKVDLSIDAFPGEKFEGKVESLSGGTGARFSLLPPDNASGNFVKVVQRVPVRIALVSAPSVPLRAGMSADVTVYEDK